MFNELLSELTPGEEHPEDRRLLHDVSGTCREMQVLLLENKQINKKKKTDIVFVICWRGALGSILLQQYTFHHSSVSRSQFLRTLLNLMIDWCTEWWLMQARILELIGLVQHRELTASLLDLNDQMNNQLLRFFKSTDFLRILEDSAGLSVTRTTRPLREELWSHQGRAMRLSLRTRCRSCH